MSSYQKIIKSGFIHTLGSIPNLLRTAIVLIMLFGMFGPSPVYAQDGVTPEPDENNVQEKNQDESDLMTDQIIIKYKYTQVVDPAGDKQMQRVSEKAGMKVNYHRPMSEDAHVLRLPARLPDVAIQATIKHIEELPEVEYAEPDVIMQHTLTPNDPLYSNQWHYFAPTTGNYGINAPGGWDISTGSSSIFVAVVDTGITNHSEFSGRTVPGYDFISYLEVANDGNGWDSDPSDPGDWVAKNECYPGSPARNSSWHGTHTAGTIGAASNNSVGVTGINWNSKLLPIRVLGKCGGYMSDIIDGMLWASGLDVSGVPDNANPARVINISLGGTGPCDSTLQNAINSINSNGTIVVASAGNSGTDASSFTPANCAGVITVAATNRNGNRASYSNYGSTIEISAPGGDTSGSVLSTLNTGTQGPAAETYAYYNGTSMAAPHVSGVASLLFSVNPTLTPSQVLQVLQNTATLFPSGSTCTTSTCGSGIVNAGAALSYAPTSVDLLSFSAAGAKKSIILNWETSNEVDNLGFNLYRATSEGGERTRINAEMIPTNVPPGSPSGASYEYPDTNLKANKTYYYWLEGVDI